jgi:triosephosphate isomerase (TIM)
MRKKIVAGNWKMNKTLSEGMILINEIKETANHEECLVIVAPPFTHLATFSEILKNSNIKLAAQNCAQWENGAFTGEISSSMIASLGAEFVIIGHSERRQFFNETNEILAEKIKLVLKNKLYPLFCCGESMQEREADKHFKTVEDQLKQSLFHLAADAFSKVIIAYEPIWAIGSGKTATSEQAQQMHQHIRSVIRKHYDDAIAENTSILYGGSCNPSNSKELFAQKDIDGGLIGGASLNLVDFNAIINSI